MALLNIVKDPDPELRLKAKPVALPLTKEKRDLILSMVDYLKKSQDEEYAKKNQIRPGVGIAAPQIGVSERFYAIYMDDEDKHYEYGLVNPVILSSSAKKAYLATGEGCLSVPKDVEGYVYRYLRVTIKAYDAISEKEVTLRLSGYPAMVFQHEYDHLDGVLYYDRIDKKEPFREDPEAVRIE